MLWIEKTAPWVLVPILLMYGLYVLLLFVNSLAAYVVEKKNKIDKIMDVLSWGGGIAFIIGIVYAVIISIILIFKRIFF